MNPLKSFTNSLFSSEKRTASKVKVSLYDIKIDSLQGKTINLSDYKGKYVLFVNVASKCGFTPQYKDLQKLHDLHGDAITIIGVPCNQFGKQEPGNALEIENLNLKINRPNILKSKSL